MNYEQLFDKVAADNGKTTFSTTTPNGGVLIWVTAQEVDPAAALLSAALSIMVARGVATSTKGISIQKMMIATAGEDYAWQVMDDVTGAVIAKGYAATEAEAAAEVAKHVKPSNADARAFRPTPAKSMHPCRTMCSRARYTQDANKACIGECDIDAQFSAK